MAGGTLANSKKIPHNNGGFSNEILKDSPKNLQPPSKKFSFSGILGLGQSVEINRQTDQLQSWGQEFFGQINHLEKEEKFLLDSRQKELEKQIQQLQDEISKLIKATTGLEKQVENVAINTIVDASDYQINFLDRIRKFIANFRQNISQAGIWLEAFAAKKKKRNFFWNQVKNKKGGGEQYLFSNEHGVARSAG